MDKRIGNYANPAESEAALREAVRQSADPNLVNNEYLIKSENSKSIP